MTGVGLDVVDVGRLARLVALRPTFEARFFGPRELAQCRVGGDRPGALARRLAAKEAFLKALGLGLDGTDLRDVEALDGAPPRLLLGPSAQAALAAAGGGAHLLTWTRRGGLALALVIVTAA